MSRSKRIYERDPNGQHARLYHEMLKSPAWIALSYSAKVLFLDLRLKLTSFNNGNIEAVFSELKHRGWKSKTTMHKALRELEVLGFISKTRQGGIASMSKICSLYRFTDHDAHDFEKQGVKKCKATYDYRRFKALRDARAAAQAIKVQHKLQRQKNPKVRNLPLSGPEIVPMPIAH